MSDSTNSDHPPPYCPTLYDETLRSVFYPHPSILSMANRANLIGKLDYHAPTTDGSFSICIAGGEGVFISKALYDSIPKEHRPVLDTAQTQIVSTLLDGHMESLGSTFIPFVLTNKETGEKFRIILYALVLPNLLMNMFIGESSPILRSRACDGHSFVWGFCLGDDENDLTFVQGI